MFRTPDKAPHPAILVSYSEVGLKVFNNRRHIIIIIADKTIYKREREMEDIGKEEPQVGRPALYSVPCSARTFTKQWGFRENKNRD